MWKIFKWAIKSIIVMVIIANYVGWMVCVKDLKRAQSLNSLLLGKVYILDDQITNSIKNDQALFKQNLENKIITESLSVNLQNNQTNINQILKSNVVVYGAMGFGAGTIIKKTDNSMYVLTCYHVVEDVIEMKNPKVFASIGYSINDVRDSAVADILYKVEVVKFDKEKDLALLKTFMVDKDLEAISIAKNEPQKGDIVYSIGTPLGWHRTISKGILANKIEGYYVTDNSITFGNSGGGLYNESGELIGAPVLVYAYGAGTNAVPESGLGWSIGLKMINDFLSDVEEIK